MNLHVFTTSKARPTAWKRKYVHDLNLVRNMQKILGQAHLRVWGSKRDDNVNARARFYALITIVFVMVEEPLNTKTRGVRGAAPPALIIFYSLLVEP